MRRMRLALAGVAALAVLTAACSGNGGEPDADPGAAETADSARISLFVASTASDILFDASCNGIADYARMRSRLVCDYADDTSMEVIEIDRQTWVRRVTTAGTAGPWTPSAPMPTGVLAMPPASLLATMRSAATREEQLGEEDVRGEPALHYRLTVDRVAAGLVDGPGETIVDIWVAEELLRRISYEDGGQRRTTEYFDYGVEVDIAPPTVRD
jgi:hypothetical protein